MLNYLFLFPTTRTIAETVCCGTVWSG